MNELVERPVLRIPIGKYFTSPFNIPPGAMPLYQAKEMQKNLPGKVECRIQGGVMFTFPIQSIELANGNILALIDSDSVRWGKYRYA